SPGGGTEGSPVGAVPQRLEQGGPQSLRRIDAGEVRLEARGLGGEACQTRPFEDGFRLLRRAARDQLRRGGRSLPLLKQVVHRCCEQRAESDRGDEGPVTTDRR